jgi:hypothetical protein
MMIAGNELVGEIDHKFSRFELAHLALHSPSIPNSFIFAIKTGKIGQIEIGQFEAESWPKRGPKGRWGMMGK